MRRTRVYEVYPKGPRFSNLSIDYTGQALTIAAVSIKQAYYFAGQRSWSIGPGELGILEYSYYDERDGQWHKLWDKCRTRKGLRLQRGDGIREITAAMRAHEAKH